MMDIALLDGKSVSQIEQHLQRAFEVLEANSATEALRKANLPEADENG
jgi:DNA-binding CsgD family transcriptional regulator